MFDEKFVSRKARELIAQATRDAHSGPPIDPHVLAQACSILSIEDKPMIPEGVLVPVRGGFNVFLQGNFASDPGMRLRRRFTLAHEIAHTFFYDIATDGLPKSAKGSPRGGHLERLCQIGAGEILLPDAILKRHFPEKLDAAERILEIAKLFDVSPEVVVRRIQKLGHFAENNFAVALVETSDDREVIQAACYGPVLLCSFPKPERGMEFDNWVAPLRKLDQNLGLKAPVATDSAEIRTRKLQRSKWSFIFEITFSRPTAKPR